MNCSTVKLTFSGSGDGSDAVTALLALSLSLSKLGVDMVFVLICLSVFRVEVVVSCCRAEVVLGQRRCLVGE
jgi:hypothetical protein